MKKNLLATLLTWLMIMPGLAFAQSSPGLFNGQIPTAAQWNGFFAAKQDYSTGAITGPSSAVIPGNMVVWGTTYPGVIDGGAVPHVTAGYCSTITGGPSYTIATSASCLALRGYIDGLLLSTAGSSHAFTAGIGAASDSTGAFLMPLGSALNKTNSATFLAGNNSGCLDTGTVANATWYHIFLIEKTDRTGSDLLCSLSFASPAMPTGYNISRRIGSLLTNGSGQWVSFVQWGDEFDWLAPVLDVNTTTLSTTATNFSLTVPPGASVRAKVRGFMNSGTTGVGVVVTSPLLTTPVVGTPAGEATASAIVASQNISFTVDVLTDTTQHLTAVASMSSTTLKIDTYGWIDRRGRNN